MENDIKGELLLCYQNDQAIIKFRIEMIVPANRTKEFCDAITQTINDLKKRLEEEKLES